MLASLRSVTSLLTRYPALSRVHLTSPPPQILIEDEPLSLIKEEFEFSGEIPDFNIDGTGGEESLREYYVVVTSDSGEVIGCTTDRLTSGQPPPPPKEGEDDDDDEEDEDSDNNPYLSYLHHWRILRKQSVLS